MKTYLAFTIVFTILAFIVLLAVRAVLNGIKGMKTSKEFDGKKMRFVYLFVSFAHLACGVIVAAGCALLDLLWTYGFWQALHQ
jgi:hypothetical protein